MKKISCQLEVEQAGRWKVNLGAVTKYYVVSTFVDPIRCCFRYTKIIHNKEAGYLAD